MAIFDSKISKRLLFERDGSNFQFGRELKGQNKTIATMTRSNSLFLSVSAQNNHQQLSGIFNYFKTRRLTSLDIQSFGL